MDGPFLADSFTLLPEAATIAQWLIHVDPRLNPKTSQRYFDLAKQARIAYLLQQPQLRLKGEPAAAVIATVPVQGMHRLLWQFLLATFAAPDRVAPDFVVYVDAVAWEICGRDEEVGDSGCSIQRERLVFHELLHLRQLETADGEPRYHEDGREMLALRRHTYETFSEEIIEYGPRTSGVEQIGPDYVIGAKAETARQRKGKLRVA